MMLTIFTPTYNRSDKLTRIYQSLLLQSCYDFEWLIIDDGSIDNTSSVINSFLAENRFKVRYYYKQNEGKHRAYNDALKLAKGNYFMCLDSDDWLKNDAVKIINETVISLKANQFIVAYKSNVQGQILSDSFPSCVNVVSLFNLKKIYNCCGEFTLVFPTLYAKNYLFPSFQGEKFITESVIYDRFSITENAKLVDKIITVCEYQSDGLSENLNTIMKQNPAGFCLYFMQRIDLQDNLKDRVITAGKYHCFCIFAGKQRSSYDGNHRNLVVVSKPLGLIFWLYYKLLRGF